MIFIYCTVVRLQYVVTSAPENSQSDHKSIYRWLFGNFELALDFLKIPDESQPVALIHSLLAMLAQ